MKKLKKITVILLVFGALFLSGAVFMQLFTPMGNIRIETARGCESFGSIREIVAISGSLPITIKYTEAEECTVSYTSPLPLIITADEQGMLRITEDDSFTVSLFNSDRIGYGIYIEIPRRAYGRISLSTSGGDITVSENISCDVMEISTRTGNITVKNADQRTKIRSESGEISLSLADLKGTMTVNGGDGEVDITVPWELPFLMEFHTDGGSCITEGFTDDIGGRKGDAALLNSDGGGNTLKINTKNGSLRLTAAE